MHEWRVPFFLIWRHLKRGSIWTLLLIIFLMAIAFINLVFVTCLFNGIIASSNTKIIQTFSGNITIYPAKGDDYIEHADKELEKIRRVDGVEAASAHYTVPTTYKWKNIKLTYRLYGIDPTDEKRVTTINESMTYGRYLDPSDTDSIIIGAQVAGDEESAYRSFKGIKVGDTITAILPNNIEKKLKLKGIFYANFIESDYQTFITKKTADTLLPSFKNAASSILIKTDGSASETTIINRLKARGVKGEMHTWQDSAGIMKSVTKSFTSIDVLLSLVGTLIAAVTIFIVIYIDINNKRQQIGILRAIGVKPYLIWTVYVLQSAVYATAGVTLGTIMFFSILVPYFNAYPFRLPIGDATLIVDYSVFILRAELVMWVAVFSGLIPAVHVTRMNMLDEIRGK